MSAAATAPDCFGRCVLRAALVDGAQRIVARLVAFIIQTKSAVWLSSARLASAPRCAEKFKGARCSRGTARTVVGAFLCCPFMLASFQHRSRPWGQPLRTPAIATLGDAIVEAGNRRSCIGTIRAHPPKALESSASQLHWNSVQMQRCLHPLSHPLLRRAQFIRTGLG